MMVVEPKSENKECILFCSIMFIFTFISIFKLEPPRGNPIQSTRNPNIN